MIKYFLIILCSLFSLVSISQNETNNWFFGERAGLNFTAQQDPTILQNSQMIAPKGSATISDRNGELLFYTNGDMIWNKNHTIMTNGILVSIATAAVFESKNFDQNSIIVPIANGNIYYVFTIGPGGLFYSIVDINLQGGLGEVTAQNVPLLQDVGISKLSAVHHADGESIWLMTTKKNTDNQFTSFYAYKINTNGSIDAPIITDNLGYKGVQDGSIKFSPNGEKLACANLNLDGLENHLTIFNFNNETGQLSNKRGLPTSSVFFEVITIYSIEFSNDSNYLYANALKQPMEGQPVTARQHILYKYDLSLINPNDGRVRLLEEANQSENGVGTLQIANNGKIYRAITQSDIQGTDFIGVIDNPENEDGNASYTDNAVNLSPNESRLGLPNFIQSYFRTRILTKKGCLGSSLLFEVDTYAEITAASWDFGDGNTSNEISPDYTYSTVGDFESSVTITINDRQITVYKKIKINPLPNLLANQELVQCDTNTDGIAAFNLYNIQEKITNPDLNENLFFYETIEDAELDVNRINVPENYTNNIENQEIFVRVVNNNNCYAISSFFIRAVFVEIGNLDAIYVCDDSDFISDNSIGLFSINQIKSEVRNQLNISNTTSISIFTTFLDAQTTQNELVRDDFKSETTTIWVRLNDMDSSCAGITSMPLYVNSNPIILLEDAYLICRSNPISLTGHSSNSRFEWINSNNEIVSNLQTFSPTETGTFTHVAYKTENGLECSNSKDFVINTIEPPVFESIVVNSEGNGNSITIITEGSNNYEFSIDNITYFGNSNTFTFTNLEAGLYTVFVRDDNQCEPTIQEDVSIIGFPKFFTPNNDGVNDYWRVKGINPYMLKSIKIYNRYGKFITSLLQSTNYGWDGKYNNQILSSNDYWFEVVFINGDIFRGHFSLKN